MNVTLEQLLLMIGAKEVEIAALKTENEELRKRLSDAEAKDGKV